MCMYALCTPSQYSYCKTSAETQDEQRSHSAPRRNTFSWKGLLSPGVAHEVAVLTSERTVAFSVI